MDEKYAQTIAGFPLFQGFTAQGAQRLFERGDIQRFAKAEILFEEGDVPTSVALVLEGAMEVFVDRHGSDLILAEAGPGTILGEIAVLCNIPRSASVRACDGAVVLRWESAVFRNLLLRYALLSERIFRESLRTLIEKEQSLIESLMEARAGERGI